MGLYKRISNFIDKVGTPENSKAQNIAKLAAFLLSKPGIKFVINKVRHALFADKVNAASYNNWINHRLNPTLLDVQYKTHINNLKNKPLISIVVPVYNPSVTFLAAAIESVINQQYTNWELCLADDVSPNPEVRQLLEAYSKKDNRIKVVFRTTNGHISECTNSALAMATGEYILFMDHDDLLTINCLFEIVKHINKHPEDRIIYSDEDKIDDSGIFSMPHFKPDWAPDNLLSRNYMGHVIVIDKKIVDQLGGLRPGFDGSQDHDLLLRATELTNNIGHIPKVLYHWRIHEHSVAMASEAKPYAYLAAQKALEEALVRRGTPGKVEHIPGILGGYRIRYEVRSYDKVSIIIPTKDQAELLRKALTSIIELTTYPDYEIILLNNNSTTPEFFALVKEFSEKYGDKFTCYEAAFPFNFSKLNNFGVSKSSGKFLLFLNNDVEVTHGDWLDQMVSFAQRKFTGAVGVKLLFPNDTIQHAGVILGLGGAAGHIFPRVHRSQTGYFNYLVSLNNYSSLTGACLMCRREVFEEVGGFDETLAVEYNDIDLCLKIMTKGYYNVYVPDVVLYHYESASRGHPFHSKAAFAQHEIDIKKFRDKWLRYIENDPFYSPNLSMETDTFSLNLDAK